MKMKSQRKRIEARKYEYHHEVFHEKLKKTSLSCEIGETIVEKVTLALRSLKKIVDKNVEPLSCEIVEKIVESHLGLEIVKKNR